MAHDQLLAWRAQSWPHHGSQGTPMNPNDPAAPEDGEIADGLTAAEATALANGEGARVHRHEFALVRAKPLPIDIVKAKAFLTACIDSAPRVSYGLGAKAASTPASRAPPARRASRRSTAAGSSGPRSGGRRCQSSPRSRSDRWSSTTGPAVKGFLPMSSTTASSRTAADRFPAAVRGRQRDRPRRPHPPGTALESHGGTGPDSRQWSTLPWRTSTKVFELTR